MTLLYILALCFLGSILGLVGGIVLLFRGKIEKETSLHLISFAAGVMISAAFLDLFPEAIELGENNVFIYALIGLVSFFFVENLLIHFHHHEGHHHSLKNVVPLLVTSDSIHNFIDGVVIAASFLVDHKLGFLVAFATFVHEVPQEIGDFGVMLSSGTSKMKTLLANLGSAFATFVGAILTYYFVGSTQGVIGPMLGLASGMFLYISTADILPEIVRDKKRDNPWHTTIFFLLGILLIILLTTFLPD